MGNRVTKGHIWEAVEDEPAHFYEILNDDEEISLRNLSTGAIVKRYKQQLIDYGRVRKPKRGER